MYIKLRKKILWLDPQEGWGESRTSMKKITFRFFRLKNPQIRMTNKLEGGGA